MELTQLKWISLTFSVFFVMFGVSDLAVSISWLVDGVNVGHTGIEFHRFLEALVALGLLLGILGFIGCLSILNDSLGTIAFCAFSTFLMAGGYLAIAVLAEVSFQKAALRLHADMKAQMISPNNMSETFWMIFENQYVCCGIDSPADWTELSPFMAVPASCAVMVSRHNDTSGSVRDLPGCFPESIKSARKAVVGCVICSGIMAAVLSISSIFITRFYFRLKESLKKHDDDSYPLDQ